MKVRAKKRYGQHFLKSSAHASLIADYLSSELSKNIIEIGPGGGMLSQFLFEKNKEVYMVEADIDMVKRLKVRFPKSRAHILHKDFLKTDISSLIPKEEQASVIGNFPYNISSQIIFKCLEHVDIIPEIVGMFQYEMSKRIIAAPGTKDYGIISVLTQVNYQGEMMLELGPDEFDPPPRVDSAVIRLIRQNRNSEIVDFDLFKRVVKTSFGQRRKMIRNTLKGLIPKNITIDEDFFQKRPEQISVTEFIALANRINEELSQQ